MGGKWVRGTLVGGEKKEGLHRVTESYRELQRVTESYRELKFFEYLSISVTNGFFFGFLVLHLGNSVYCYTYSKK